LLRLFSLTSQLRHAIDRINDEMKSIEIVEHTHVEGRQRKKPCRPVSK